MPWRAKILSWRFNGRPSAYLDTSTCASSPALALLLGIGEGCASATTIEIAPSFIARYLART